MERERKKLAGNEEKGCARGFKMVGWGEWSNRKTTRGG